MIWLATNKQRHRNYTHIVLDHLEECNLYLKPEKCSFKQEEIEYLNIIVGKGVLRIDPKKVKVKDVATWKESHTVTNI